MPTIKIDAIVHVIDMYGVGQIIAVFIRVAVVNLVVWPHLAERACKMKIFDTGLFSTLVRWPNSQSCYKWSWLVFMGCGWLLI